MKRKIKLLFIAISIFAMLFAFAISSSAWSVHPHSYSDYAVLMTEDDVVAYVWYYSGYEDCCVSVDFSMDLTNIRSYTLSNNFGANIEYSDEQIFTLIEEYIASVKASMTEGMFTQDDVDSAVDEAVAKALADAGVVLGNGMVMSPSFPENLLDGLSDVQQFGTLDEIQNSFNYLRLSLLLKEGGTSDYIYMVDINGFKNFCSSNNITTASEFKSYINTLMNSFEAYSTPYNYCNGLSSIGFVNEGEIFNYFYNYENPPTTEDLQAKYDEGYAQGETDGVTEYKQSQEYTDTINLAKSAGADEYKQSDAYFSSLNSKYNEGHLAGVEAGALSYKSSQEYKSALSNEYDSGYDDGYEDGEQSINFAPFIVGIIILATVAIVLVIFNEKRKKSYRHR